MIAQRYLKSTINHSAYIAHPSLQESSLGCSGSRAGKGRRACLRNFNSTSNSPVAPSQLSCQISANQRKAETSANVNKHRKAGAKGNDIITNVISTNQHLHQLFRCRYSNSRDIVACSPSFSRPAARAPGRACSQAMPTHMSQRNLVVIYIQCTLNCNL